MVCFAGKYLFLILWNLRGGVSIWFKMDIRCVKSLLVHGNRAALVFSVVITKFSVRKFEYLVDSLVRMDQSYVHSLTCVLHKRLVADHWFRYVIKSFCFVIICSRRPWHLVTRMCLIWLLVFFFFHSLLQSVSKSVELMNLNWIGQCETIV